LHLKQTYFPSIAKIPSNIGKQGMGTYIYSLLYTYTGLLGQLLHEVLQPFMCEGPGDHLGRLKKPPVPSTLGLWHHLYPMAGTRSTRRRLCFYSCNTLAAGLPGGETCSDCLYLVGSQADKLQLQLRLFLDGLVHMPVESHPPSSRRQG
jgi:hypothetical protein